MKITDNTGKDIGIDNLDLALMQADDNRHYRISGKDSEVTNQKQTAYWQDIYRQLLRLREERDC